jgi:hypothetical protein
MTTFKLLKNYSLKMMFWIMIVAHSYVKHRYEKLFVMNNY